MNSLNKPETFSRPQRILGGIVAGVVAMGALGILIDNGLDDVERPALGQRSKPAQEQTSYPQAEIDTALGSYAVDCATEDFKVVDFVNQSREVHLTSSARDSETGIISYAFQQISPDQYRVGPHEEDLVVSREFLVKFGWSRIIAASDSRQLTLDFHMAVNDLDPSGYTAIIQARCEDS